MNGGIINTQTLAACKWFHEKNWVFWVSYPFQFYYWLVVIKLGVIETIGSKNSVAVFINRYRIYCFSSLRILFLTEKCDVEKICNYFDRE